MHKGHVPSLKLLLELTAAWLQVVRVLRGTHQNQAQAATVLEYVARTR
jgi:hypothetical protein